MTKLLIHTRRYGGLCSKGQIAIEYDGRAYHQDKRHKDLKKNEFLKENGIKLIRILEFEKKRKTKPQLEQPNTFTHAFDKHNSK
jgi:very-short-patch-repair endonuclease